MMRERYLLAADRIKQIEDDNQVKAPYSSYFKCVALFLVSIFEVFDNIEEQGLSAISKDTLMEWNEKMYDDILIASYSTSYANPEFAVKELGDIFGGLLSFVYTEMRTIISAAYESDLFEMVIRAELFLEIYNAFYYEFEELDKAPTFERVREIIYWFVSDYSEEEMQKRIAQKVDPSNDFAKKIILEADLFEETYLYRFGEYIADNQIQTSKYLASMPEETIKLMADTYTEGYRIGFVKGNKDLSKKKVANIVFPIGFERVVKHAISNFEQMGLDVTLMRTSQSVFHKRGTAIAGYYTTNPNRQFSFDHREDEALFLDKKLVNRKLETFRQAYESLKDLAKVHAGPAWIEVFGEIPFLPLLKKEAFVLNEEQQKLSTHYYNQMSQILNEYINGEERSFTIIAFPIPEIGEEYEHIMSETIALNTLPYETYEAIQQTMIDALDQAECVRVVGSGENKTQLTVSLYPLNDSKKETIFENCVADVNIPVGEIFTSPVLKGTNGVLHVTKVFLHEFEFRDFMLTFEDGMITSYSCSNFDNEEENIKYIKDNVLFHHESLPMGEFAIGTNTTAYVMGKKYNIENKLPILIAEKTGPHFAVGDTCYSHSEDVAVFNADGKEIVARDNEKSIQRKEHPEKAYYGCHTDITIPYDELFELTGIKKSGELIPIIKNGRFVLEGTTKLNEPFKQY